MRIEGITWLEEVVEKLRRKHRVSEHEVEEALLAAPQFRFVEAGFRQGEDVYAALGRAEGGRYLIVFFVLKADRHALIISARDMTRTERRRYERE